MKDRVVEWIRQLLIKTVIPFRKRKAIFLSKFRFSMSFRITFHFFWLLILIGAIILMPVIWFVYQTELPNYALQFHHGKQEFQVDFEVFIWGTVGFYGALILLVSRISQGGIAKLLSPIETMSAAASRLTVTNLHSERLNVQGTQNELKELAGTINKMLDRIEISYESQKQFVSDASHELRTPIAVIQGYVNLLDRWGKKDEEIMEEAILAIKNESKAMQELVEKLLFLSRHDKKTLKLKKEKFNMCEVIENMVKETKMVVNNRTIESPCLEDVTVYGDKQALKQAVRVFVDNAVKYTKDGDAIRISCQNKDGDCIIIVEDTGIGMTRQDLNHIFERFYRSDTVRNAKITGHGLGLSIAKLIIVKHTGRINVRSQLTKGSIFTITIPKRDSFRNC